MTEETSSSSNTFSLQRAVSLDFIRNSGGFAVKALPNQKEPARGWDPKTNSRAKSEKLLSELATTDDNLGIHLFQSLVDVDVDCEVPFLLEALDMFLPSCAHVWGRKSRPKSHRVYVLKGASDYNPADYPFLKRLSRIPEAKVEVRGGPLTAGKYSLLPGSIHPSGEPYEWVDLARARSTPSMTSIELILRGVRLAGAVAVLAPHWQEGARNQLVMALSGLLHRVHSITANLSDEYFSMDYDAAKQFVEVLLIITGDEPADKVSRLKTFEQTWRKAENDMPVTGANTIAEITGDHTIVAKLYTLLSDSPDIATIEKFTSRFVIWQGPGMVIDLDMVARGAMRPIMTRMNFVNSWAHEFVDVGGKKRMLADMVYHMRSTTRVTGLTFEPGGDRIVSTREGPKVNQWSGFETEPWKTAVTNEDVKPFLSYVWEVLANEDQAIYEWVLGWCAHIFQKPAKKAKTALVIVGLQGAGKSFLGHQILIPIIGEHHSATVNRIEQVTKDFNAAYDNKLFIQGDEATNNRQKSIALRMRALITDDYQMVEPKGVDPYRKPMHARFLFTSNEADDAIFLQGGSDDRRYTIIEASPRYKGQLEGYWFPLLRWTEDKENLRKVHRWFKDYEFDELKIRLPLMTESKANMQQRSWDPFDGWLGAWVARGHPLGEQCHDNWYDAPISKVVNTKASQPAIDRTDWPELISFSALARDLAWFCRTNFRGEFGLNEYQLSVALRKRGLIGESDKPVMLRISEFDEKKGKKIEKRVRVYPAPVRSLVETYMLDKYGLEPQSDDAEDVVVRSDIDDVTDY